MALEQENDLWQAILGEADPVRRRVQLMEMAKLLFGAAAVSSDELSAWQEDDLFDLLLEYQQAAEAIQEFLSTAHACLDPVGEAEFVRQLQALQQTLVETAAENRRIAAQHGNRVEQEQALQAEVEQLEQTRHQAETLERNIAELRQRLEALTPERKRLENLSADAHSLHAEIIQAMVTLLPRLVELLRENHGIYETHFSANHRITEAVARLEDIEGLVDQVREVERLDQETRNQLSRADQLLGRLVETIERGRQALNARQH